MHFFVAGAHGAWQRAPGSPSTPVPAQLCSPHLFVSFQGMPLSSRLLLTAWLQRKLLVVVMEK